MLDGQLKVFSTPTSKLHGFTKVLPIASQTVHALGGGGRKWEINNNDLVEGSRQTPGVQAGIGHSTVHQQAHMQWFISLTGQSSATWLVNELKCTARGQFVDNPFSLNPIWTRDNRIPDNHLSAHPSIVLTHSICPLMVYVQHMQAFTNPNWHTDTTFVSVVDKPSAWICCSRKFNPYVSLHHPTSFCAFLWGVVRKFTREAGTAKRNSSW